MISLQSWFSYHVWGTARQLDHLATLPANNYEQELQSVFPSIKVVFEHVWVVDYLWLQRMKGETQPKPPEKQLQSINEAKQQFALLHEEIQQFIKGHEDFTTPLSFKTMKGTEMQNTVEEMIYTVVNHGSYHRGNVTAMHRQLGYEGVGYDYIYYLNEQRK